MGGVAVWGTSQGLEAPLKTPSRPCSPLNPSLLYSVINSIHFQRESERRRPSRQKTILCSDSVFKYCTERLRSLGPDVLSCFSSNCINIYIFAFILCRSYKVARVITNEADRHQAFLKADYFSVRLLQSSPLKDQRPHTAAVSSHHIPRNTQ